MGQYYKAVNIDKKEYMYPDGGLKLVELCYNTDLFVLNVMKKLANEWKGDRVFIVGDYALSKDRIHNGKKYYDYDLLTEIEKELNIYNKVGDDGVYITLYDFADDHYKEIELEKLDYFEVNEYRYIYNHRRKEFIDLEHCPLLSLSKEKNEYILVRIAPIVLLLALGNGIGGGDYSENGENLVGKYIYDIKELEVTKEQLRINYTEFRPEFYMYDYIPYNEIPNIINLEKQKENNL